MAGTVLIRTCQDNSQQVSTICFKTMLIVLVKLPQSHLVNYHKYRGGTDWMVVTDIRSYLWWSKTGHKKICVRSSFLIKYTITREFTENQTVLLTLIGIKFCHTSYPPELSIFTKDTNEVASKSARSTRNRKRPIVFCSKCGYLAYKSVYLGTLI